MLREYTDLDLYEELSRRKNARESKPEILDGIKLTDLIKLCREYMEQVEKGMVDDDMEHYIFEETLKAVYGNNVFDWVNENIQ